MGLPSDYHGRPIWAWIIILGLSMIGAWMKGQRRKEWLNGTNPFKDISPTRSAITCPRCGAPWPSGYQPRSHREIMWKGVVCQECKCEYDEHGRERRQDKRGHHIARATRRDPTKMRRNWPVNGSAGRIRTHNLLVNSLPSN